MDLPRPRPQYWKLPGFLGGILAAIAITGALPTEGAGRAPQEQETSSQERPPTFKLRVERNLVPVRVVVRDRQGRAVGGLRKEDFKLFDNGKPQVITYFSIEGAAKVKPDPQGRASAISRLRYLGLFFDDQNSNFEHLYRARNAAERFLRTAVGPSDRVGIFTSSRVVTVDFTDDRAKLHDALSRLMPVRCPAQEPERVLCLNLGHLVRRMGTLPGERLLILISAGYFWFSKPSVWNMFDELVDRALRSNVIISSLDPRGLPVEVHRYLPILIPWDQQSPSSIYSGPPSVGRALPTPFAVQQALSLISELSLPTELGRLAKGTGGEWFHDDNDLAAGLAKLAATPEVYYTLAFSPKNLKYNGRFHNLKVKLVNRKGLSVVARGGYFAPTRLPRAEAQANEEFAAAVFADTELKELPVDVRTEVVSKEKGHGLLWVLVHLDLRSLRFRKEQDTNANELTFATALFDREGKYVTGKRRRVPLRLRDAELEKLLASGMDLKTTFVLKPGTYLIREVVRDSEDGHLAALNSIVEIPF